MNQNPSKHEQRMLKLEQRKQEKEIKQREAKQKEKTKKLLTYGVAALTLVVLTGIAFSIFTAPRPEPQNLNIAGLSFPLGNIHWHATPLIEICGEQKTIPTPMARGHLGSPLFHTHEDALIHIEGAVSNPSQITLGAFFDNIAVRFSQTEIMDKKNGDACPDGSAGQVKMAVNNVPNSEFRNYVVKDGDVINIKFD